MKKTMTAKEFLGEELYSIIEKLFIQTNQSSKESNRIVIKALRGDARNTTNEKVSLLLNEIANRIETM